MRQINDLADEILELIESGDFDTARSISTKLIDAYPNQASLYFCLGKINSLEGEYKIAIKCLSKAFDLEGANVDIAALLIHNLIKDEQFDLTLDYIKRALIFNPNNPRLISFAAKTYFYKQDFDASLANYRLALDFDKNSAEYFNGYANVLRVLGRFDEALDSYKYAINLDKNNPILYNNYANVLNMLGDFENAIKTYNVASKINPDFIPVLNHLALTYVSQKQYKKAYDCYNNAILKSKNNPEIIFNKSMLDLLIGDYKNGWKNYEYRKQTPHLIKNYREFSKPIWSGKEPLNNKTIFVYSEQGLGDTIQFCRYILMLKDLGANIIFEVQRELYQIMLSLSDDISYIVKGDKCPSFDYHAPLMSLPFLFSTDLSSIPKKNPYLFADTAKKHKWAEKLNKSTNIKIGIIWSGGFRKDMPELWNENERRNISLKKIESLLNIKNKKFYSLQKGELAESQLEQLGKTDPFNKIIDLSMEINDFSDTAAIIENLDLIISVDTSTAHLAAALGKNVWLLNRYDTCWRWLDDGRSDSPWYTSIRLFRQPKPNDWESVVNEVHKELHNL